MNHVFLKSRVLITLFAMVVAVPVAAQPEGAPAPVNVTTYKYDNYVSGINSKETVLTPTNVNVATFGQLFTDPVDSQVYAQPLYLSNVAIPNKGTHNVVYVATCHDTVYAFDADAGGDPLWVVSFLDPDKGITSVPQQDIIAGDITPEVGIVSTPVIDPSSGTLYVVSKTKETGRGDNHNHYVQKLHALDVATGAEKFNGPSVIGDVSCDDPSNRNTEDYDYNLSTVPQTPSVKGSSKFASDGTLYFNALRANQRPALVLSNGVVYISWASHGDNRPYNGWLIGFDAKTLAPLPNSIFCVTPDGEEGGIWQSGAGPSVDANGNLYVSTGNGEFNGDKDGGRNWSQSILKFFTASGLSAANAKAGDGQTLDFFTPFNEQDLSNGDVDIGSAGVLLFDVPNASPSHFAIGTGKEGTYYVINRDDMGGFDPATDHVVQKFEGGRREIMGTPIFFNNTIFYNRSGEELRARAFTNGQFADNFTQTASSFNGRGGGPVISANGTTNGIVWMLNNGGPASLEAFSVDALTSSGSTDPVPPLFDGRMPDGGVKFTNPIVANGKVYAMCASRKGNEISSAHLCVFGLLANSDDKSLPTAPTHVQASSSSPESVVVTWVNHDPNVSGFIIQRSSGDATSFSQVGTAGNGASSYQDNTVTGGTPYHYCVVAVNKNGHSDNSETADVTSHDYITEDGLVAYWAFDEGNGNDIVDLTGHNHAGKISGETSWSQGIRNSPGLEFHGTGNAMSHVEVADAPELDFGANQSFSLVAWARPASQPGHWAGVVTKSRNTPTGWYGIYISPDNQWSFRGTDDKADVAGGTVTPNSWQQIVAVQDGTAGTRTLYVNGVQVATGPAAQAADGTGPLWIGQGNANQEAFAGNLDDVRVYNRALAATDVKTLFGSFLPSVTLSSPADNSTVPSPASLTLTADVTAPGNGATINQVHFYQGTKELGASGDAPYSFTWKDVPPGDYVLYASASDTNGNNTPSQPVHVKVTP